MENPGFMALYKKKSMFCKKMRPPQNYIQTWDTDRVYPALTPEGSQGDEAQQDDAMEVERICPDTLEKVASNYVIIRKIISKCSWQDAKMLSMVCKLWEDAGQNVSRHHLSPQELCLHSLRPIGNMIFQRSHEMKVEPMLTLAFVNSKAMVMRYVCNLYPESPCAPSCLEKHKMLDYLYAKVCYPNNSLLGVACEQVTYNPCYTNEHQYVCSVTNASFIGGLSIPQVAGVRVRRIRWIIKSSGSALENAAKTLTEVNKIMDTELIKAILIFSSEKIGRTAEPFIQKLVEVVKERQGKENPFAVGGCMVTGAILDDFNYCKPTEMRKVLLVVVSIDKETQSNIEFEAYSSVVAEMNDKTKQEMEPKIARFAERISKREYSAAFKLSCVGRIEYNDIEKELFNLYFPRTPMVGCYGMGEIGLEDRSGEQPSERKLTQPQPKRSKAVDDDYLFHIYSTVMVIFTWGRLL